MRSLIRSFRARVAELIAPAPQKINVEWMSRPVCFDDSNEQKSAKLGHLFAEGWHVFQVVPNGDQVNVVVLYRVKVR